MTEKWAGIASGLAEAIIERALSMPMDELKAFIVDTEAGKRIAHAGDKEIASAACIVRSALLQGTGPSQDASMSVDERLQETVKAILCDSCGDAGEEPEQIPVSKQSDSPPATTDKRGTRGTFLQFSTARRHLPQSK
ncbi:hypothetical protein C3Z06_32415 (plasmid) [Cupriavidus metallidurans]|nr:hypothetical protein C3Z06_32415 [Cupriavidus metallidurans]